MGQHLAGFETGNAAKPREALFSHEGTIVVPALIDAERSIDGKNVDRTDEIRAGWFLGRSSASGRFVPCKRTRADGAGTSATAMSVDDASAFKAGDVVTIAGSNETTLSAVNYETNVLTLGTARSWSDNAVVAAADGSGVPRGVLLDNVRLRNSDEPEASCKSAGMLVQGLVRSEMLLGDAATIRLDFDPIRGILFSDDYGQ